MVSNPEQSLVERHWETFAATDIDAIKEFGVLVTAKNFHMPTGLDREAIYFNAQGLSQAALFMGCNAVNLSTFRGGASVEEYGVYEDGHRHLMPFATRWTEVEQARAYTHYIDDVEGVDGELTVLELMINYDQVIEDIREDEGSLTGVDEWANITNRHIKESLKRLAGQRSRVFKRLIKKLVANVDFIEPRIATPPIVQ